MIMIAISWNMSISWLIKQIVESLKTGEVLPEPTYQEKIAQCLAHGRRLMEIEPEKIAMFQMRGHAPWYIKGLKSSARVKNELSKIDTFEQLEHIFEPYYTTKNTETNFGLGLPYCMKIMRKHAGNIEADTILHGGSRFTLSFPLKRICKKGDRRNEF